MNIFIKKKTLKSIFIKFGFFLLLIPSFFIPRVFFYFAEKSVPKNSHIHNVNIISEIGFLEHMISHHTEAVESSQKLLRLKSLDPEFKSFLENVVQNQSSEITLMETTLLNLLKTEKLPEKYFYTPMMRDTDKIYFDNIKVKIYIIDMISHHQMALDTAKQALNINLSPNTQKLAGNIIQTQQAEVIYLQTLL